MSDIGSCDVVVKTLRIVFDYYFTLTLALILSFYELLLKIIISKRLHKRAKLFLMVIASRSTWIYKNGRANHCSQTFWFLKLPLIYVEHNKQVEVYAFIVVGGWAEFDSTEVDLSIDHLHLALSPNAHIDEGHPISFFILCVLLDCKNLSLG